MDDVIVALLSTDLGIEEGIWDKFDQRKID